MGIRNPYLIGYSDPASGSSQIQFSPGAGAGVAPNPGDAILVVGTSNGAPGDTVTGVSDGTSNVYTLLASNTATSNSRGSWAYICLAPANTLTSASTITITFSGSTVAHTGIAAGLPGIAAVNAVDQLAPAANNSGVAPHASTASAIGWQQELAIAVECNGGPGGGVTWATGWNSLVDVAHSTSTQYTSIAYQITSTAGGTVSANASMGGSSSWSMLLFTLLPAAYVIGDVVAAGATVTIPVTTTTSLGDGIVVGGSSSGHAVIQSITDTQSNVYAAGPQNISNGGATGSVWTATGETTPLTAGTDSIAVTFTGANAHTAIAVGVPGAIGTDVSVSQGGNTTTPSVTSGGQQEPVEYAVAVEVNANAGGAIAWAAGWAALADLPNSTSQYTAAACQPLTSAAPMTASGVITSASWSMMLVTLLGTPPTLVAASTGRPVRARLDPVITPRGTVRSSAAAPVSSGMKVRRRHGPEGTARRAPGPELAGRVRRSRGAPVVAVAPAAGPVFRRRGPVTGRRPGPERYGTVHTSTGSPVVPPLNVRVRNTWTASRSIVSGFAQGAPASGSLDCPVTPTGTASWLIAFCSQTLVPGFLGSTVGSTVGVADDVHGWWQPVGAPNGDTSPTGYTTCSIWARPGGSSQNPAPVPEHVYVYPAGPGLVYPAIIGVTVIEVTGLSPYLGIPAVATTIANAGQSVSLTLGAPTSAALLLGVAASDSGAFSVEPGAPWKSLTGVAVNDPIAIGTYNGVEMVSLNTAPVWQVASTGQTATWGIPGSQSDLSACCAMILTTNTPPSQPNPSWPATQLLAGFGAGASTPPSQITWTDLTSRLLEAEVTATRGKQYELDQTTAGQITLTLDNNDSALTPGNSLSPYSPNVVADTPFTLLMTWQGRTYSQFFGYLSQDPQSWSDSTRFGMVQLTLNDSWGLLNNQLSSCQQQEILASGPYAYWPCDDNAGSGYAQNAAPGNTNPLVIAESKGGSGGAAAQFGQNSGLNDGDPDATTWAQTGLGPNDLGYGYVLMCEDGNYPGLDQGMTIMTWLDPGPTTLNEVTISSGSSTWTAQGSSPASFTGNTPVQMWGGTVPNPFNAGQVYYVTGSGSSFGLAASPGGTAIKATQAGDTYIWTGQPPGANLYLIKGSSSATGDAFVLMLGYKAGYTPGALYMRVYDRYTRQVTETQIDSTNWLSAGNSNFALAISQTSWQVLVNGGAADNQSGTCNLPSHIQWLAFGGSADRFYTGSMLNCGIGHAAVFPGLLPLDRIAQITIAGNPASSGGQFPEPPASRIERLLGYGGWAGPRAFSTSSPTIMAPISDIQGTPGYVSASGQVTQSGGQAASQAATNIITSDLGWCYSDGNGVLCYYSRIDLYGQQPMWLLGEHVNSGEQPVQPGITFGYDKSLLYNVAQLTQSTGSGTAVNAQDSASVDQHSASVYTATVYQNALTDTIDMANWIVNTKGQPENRAATVTVDAAANTTNWPFVLGVEPADALRVTRRPVTSQAVTQVQAVAAQVTRKFSWAAGTASATCVTDNFPEGQSMIIGDPVLGQANGSNYLGW